MQGCVAWTDKPEPLFFRLEYRDSCEGSFGVHGPKKGRDLTVFSLQTPGPAGKNEEKAQVLTEKIEDLVVQVDTTWI